MASDVKLTSHELLSKHSALLCCWKLATMITMISTTYFLLVRSVFIRGEPRRVLCSRPASSRTYGFAYIYVHLLLVRLQSALREDTRGTRRAIASPQADPFHLGEKGRDPPSFMTDACKRAACQEPEKLASEE